MTKPLYRRPLNNKQIQLLQTLYKFRFATTKLIASSKQTDERLISKRLKILLDQEYIGRHYNSTYRIIRKSADYYLRPNAIAYLKLQVYSNPKILNSIYHDNRASQTQIDHCLNLFEIYIRFKKLYPDIFKFYSRNELVNRLDIPVDTPDAQITRIKSETNLDNDYFLESYEDSILYNKLIVKIRRFINYADSGDWEKLTDNKLPTILIVCESKTLQRRVIRLVQRELDRDYVELKFLAITKEKLVDDRQNTPKWIKISDENDLVEDISASQDYGVQKSEPRDPEVVGRI